jgi:hypothetical protein
LEIANALIETRRHVEELQDAQESAAEATRRQEQAFGTLATRMTGVLANAESLEQGIRGVAAALIEMEARALIEGTGTSIIGSIVSGLTGGITGGATAGLAGGGAVSPRMPHVVGERGPEIFVPEGAGRIMNNAMSRSAAGGGGSVTYQIDARGADQGTVARLEAVMARHVATHDSIVTNAVRKGRAERRL